MLAVRTRSLALVALPLVLLCATQAFWPQESGASTVTATGSGQAPTSTEEAEGTGLTSAGSSAEPSSPTTTGSGVPQVSASTPTVVGGSGSSTSTPGSRPSVATQPAQPPEKHVPQAPAPERHVPQAQAYGSAKHVATQKDGGTAGAQVSPNPAEPSTPAPSPGALFPASLAFTGTSPLLNFFLKTYRTPPFLLPVSPWRPPSAMGFPGKFSRPSTKSRAIMDWTCLSSAGAEGWMQFLPEEWLIYGVDANGAGVRDPNNPADATFATARYLAAAGAAHQPAGGNLCLQPLLKLRRIRNGPRTELIATTPQSLISSLTAIVSGPLPGGGWRTPQRSSCWRERAPPGARRRATRPTLLARPRRVRPRRRPSWPPPQARALRYRP